MIISILASVRCNFCISYHEDVSGIYRPLLATEFSPVSVDADFVFRSREKLTYFNSNRKFPFSGLEFRDFEFSLGWYLPRELYHHNHDTLILKLRAVRRP